MALMGWPQLKIELDESVGGSLGDISAYVTSINGYSLEYLVEELTAAGDSTDRWAAIGFTQKADVVLKGPYDNTSNKLVDIARRCGGGQLTLQLTFDLGTAADVEAVEVLVQKVVRIPKPKGLTDVEVTLKPTGAIS